MQRKDNYCKKDQNDQNEFNQNDLQTQAMNLSNLQQQCQKINLNTQQQNLHESKSQPSSQYANLEQVIVDKEEIDEQKFIESNSGVAASQKKLGNQNYQAGQYSDALLNYRKSLQYTDCKSEEDKKWRSIIYSNIGLTYTKMHQEDQAIEYFQRSLKINEKYIKARINLALCYEKSNKIQEALEQYKKVLEINPNDFFVKNKIQPLEIKVKDLQEKRKQEVISGLKNIGNSILGYFGMSLDNFKLEKGPGGGYNISMKQ